MKIQLTFSNEVSTKLMCWWIEALNYTLILLSSREIDQKVTKLFLLYVARKVCHANIWVLTKTKNAVFYHFETILRISITIKTF